MPGPSPQWTERVTASFEAGVPARLKEIASDKHISLSALMRQILTDFLPALDEPGSPEDLATGYSEGEDGQLRLIV